MKLAFRVLVFAVTVFLAASWAAAAAQAGKFYSSLNKDAGKAGPLPGFTAYRLVQQDIPAFQQYIASATGAVSKGAATAVTIIIPLADGRDVLFSLTQIQVLSPEAAAANPQIKTFKGVSADGAFMLRMTASPLGMMGTVRGEGALFYFSPLSPTSPGVLLLYNAKDIVMPATGVNCTVKDEENNRYLNVAKDHSAVPLFGDGSIRTYRYAVAATGEYTTFFGSQAAALAAITNTINNVNAIYEVDLGIQFTVVTTNAIIYTSASTDPYSTVAFPSGTTLSQNQTAIDGAIGTANYDLGMVFNDGWSGGLATLSSTCISSVKAKGAAGLDHTQFPPGPQGSVFDNTVAHETGHKFSATHSFAGNTGSCNGNTTGSTGWEPGGGSTLMAYAGTCTGLAYQLNSDSYFHGGNLEQMSNFMISTATCASTSANSNAAPTVTANDGTAFTIPASTPFRLKGYAFESESNLLSYDWEELDPVGGTGTASAPAPTNTSGPMFRSFPPVSNNTRYLPSLAALAGVNPTTYEVLPSVARNMTFRVTVRDNIKPGGRTGNQDVVVSTVACASPFAFTSQATTGTFTANGANIIPLTWNTASACVTCANLNVRFSTDGGRSYPYVVARNIANSGAYSLIVPDLPTTTGRIMLECASNIFFNINAADQTITSACAANGATFSPATGLYVSSAGNPALNQTLTPQYGTAITTPITGSLTAANDTGILTVYSSVTTGCQSYNGNITNFTTYTFIPGTSGSYTFTTSNTGLVMDLYDSAFFNNDPCRNFLASSATTNGSSTSLGASITRTLSKNKTYVLAIGTFAAGSPALPAAYSISVSGGAIYTNTPMPGGLTYSYVIVNNATGKVVSVQATGDMSNAATFPAGSYTIYGLSSGSTAAALNSTYANTSFAAMQTAIYNQTGGLCASLSSNSRNVGISTPLPVTIAAFDGRLTDRRTAMIYWQTGVEQGIADYEAQRSYDGNDFTTIGHVAAQNKSGADYIYTDNAIAEAATQVFYRLKVNELSGGSEYSGTVRFGLGAVAGAVTIAPNPAVNDRLEATAQSASAGNYELSITDLTGRTLVTVRSTLQAGGNRISLPIAELAAGVYLFRVRGENMLVTEKFVKQ